MNMKKIINLLLLFAFALQGHAQQQTANWAFGTSAGLTWNTTRSLSATGLAGTPNATLDGLPTTISNIKINTGEGCFTMSDASGQLLFYSDGMSIWDKTNTVMPNANKAAMSGLTGNSSSAQSGIIIPYPGNPNQYVAVTIDQFWNNNLAYSVIDMTLRGGLGDVVAGKKNIPLTGGSGAIGETVTAILDANGTDYWIIALGRSNYMNAWKLTSNGVVAPSAPVKSMFPAGVGINSANVPNGYLKITPDGKHFAVAGSDTKTVIYGDFNNSTGTFSNARQITGFDTSTYGIEFSKSMNYLYVGGTAKLYVYDFNALLATTNPSSVTPKKIAFGNDINGLQMGPDNRIYATAYGQSYLYVVDNPEEYDNLKTYQLPANFLGSGISRIGLPSFSGSWFTPPPAFCYSPAVTAGTREPFKTIVSTLDRTASPRNWSDPRTGSLILESQNKGLVLTRIASPETAIANPVEGMLVFDTTNKVLKFYNGTVWKILEQGCPN